MRLGNLAVEVLNWVFEVPKPQKLLELLRLPHLEVVVALGVRDHCLEYADDNCDRYQEQDQKY